MANDRDVKKMRARRTCFLLCTHDGSLLLLGARKLCAGLLVISISRCFPKSYWIERVCIQSFPSSALFVSISSGLCSECRQTHLSSQLGLVLFSGLIALVAACHFRFDDRTGCGFRRVC